VEKTRVVATVSWELEIPPNGNVSKIARESLATILPADFEIFISKTNIRHRKPQLQKLGEFSLDEVFSRLTTSDERLEFQVGEQIHLVRMNSHRYFVFKQNSRCVSCGLEGTKFMLEQHPNDKSPHFNLYGEEDGRLVLFTKDHIKAKSHGGEDRYSNYQTMCAICNNLKSDLYIPLAGVTELRQIYDENKGVARKKLNGLLHDARRRLMIPIPEDKPVPGYYAQTDLVIMRTEAGLICFSVYDYEDKGEHIASIKKGMPLYPIELRDKKLILPFNSTQFELHQGLAETAFCDTGS